MKKNTLTYIFKYCLLIIALLIGLSCDEANSILNNQAPSYNLTMNVIGPADNIYYANSCQGCDDPDPIEIQVTLKNYDVPVSDSEITFTYESSDISISDPFENSIIKTSSSGIGKAYYNDSGQTGKMQITATYLNPSYPDTVWSALSDELTILPYHTLVNSFELLSTDASPQVTTGSSVSALEIRARIKDVNGNPLQYMPVRFYSDNPSIVFSELEVFSDEQGFATITITHPEESANDFESTSIYARLNFNDLNDTQAKLKTLVIPIIEPPLPDFSLSLELDTEYDLANYDLDGDGTSDGNYFYADGPSNLVKFIARLTTTNSTFSIYNQPIILSWDGDGSLLDSEENGFDQNTDGKTNANGYVYFWFDDDFDPGDVTFTASYDYQDDNEIDATASIKADFAPYYLAIDDVTSESLLGATNVVSGYNDENADSVSIKITVLDENGIGLENINVGFSADETPVIDGEALGTFVTDTVIPTDSEGEAVAIWKAYTGREGGTLTINSEIIDDPNSNFNQTVNYTVSPPFYGDVASMSLQSDPVLPIQIESTSPEYSATFTARVTDNDGVGLPNILVNFTSEGLGAMDSPNCVTGSSGNCDIKVDVGYSDIDIKDSIVVFSCITLETLQNAGVTEKDILGYKIEPSINTYDVNKKNKKINKRKNKSLQPIQINNLNPYSSRNDCIGISDSATVILIERDLFAIEQVEFLELYTTPNTLVIEQEDEDSTFTISFRASTGEPNVPIEFYTESNNIAPLNILDNGSPYGPGYTNNQGEAIATALIQNPADFIDSNYVVTAYIEDLFTESIWSGCGTNGDAQCESNNSISITYPEYEYNLSIIANTSNINYADDEAGIDAENLDPTPTAITITLTDDSGFPMSGKTILTEITNNDSDYPEGQLINLNDGEPDNGLTDSNGKIYYSYEDSGQSGEIEIVVTYIDQYENTATTSTTFEVEPVENLVSSLSLIPSNADNLGAILITDAMSNYTTPLTASVSDENGNAVPSVDILFRNIGVGESSSLGALELNDCSTTANGSCNNTLNTGYFDIGLTEIQACVTFETLEEIVALSGGTISFPELKNYKKNKTSIHGPSSIKKKNKNKKGFESLLSPLNFGDDNFCSDGILASYTLEFIHENQYYSELVNNVTLASDPVDLVLVSDTTAIYNTTLYITASDDVYAGLQNVPINLSLSTEFGTVSPSICTTNSNGSCQATLTTANNDLGDVAIQACAYLSPDTPCADHTLTFIHENQYYSELVSNVTLNSDPSQLVLVSDSTTVYNTTLYLTASDDQNAGLANVPIDLSLSTEFGTVSPSICMTNLNGSCQATLTTANNDLGDVAIQACANLSPDTPCADHTLTFIHENQYYSELVSNVTLTSDPVDLVLVSDSTAVYNTTLYLTASDSQNAGLPSVPIDLSILSAFGTISPSTCTTDESGNCEAILTTASNDLGDAVIQSCANLSPNVSCANHSLTFIHENQYYSELVNNVTIISTPADVVVVGDTSNYNTTLYLTASDSQNAGLPNVPIQLSLLTDFGTIAPSVCTTDESGNCEAILNTTNDTSNLGTSTIQACATLASPSEVCGQHSLDFMTNEQIQCEQVADILTWVSVGEQVSDNAVIAVVDTIFARTLDIDAQPVANVPIAFSKINDIYNLGYVVPNSPQTDSLGLAYAVYTPDFSNYDGNEEFVDVEFQVSVECENNDLSVEFDIEVENQVGNNVEYQAEFFNFFPDPDNDLYYHLLGNNSYPEVLARNEFGVGICNIPVYWKLYESDGLGSIVGSCQDSGGNPLSQYSTPFECFENGTWVNSDPSGTISSGFTLTQCSEDSTGTVVDSTIVQGTSQITYVNEQGGNDVLAAYIKDPFENKMLRHDAIYFETNGISLIQAWASNPTINVTTTDSVYCDTVRAIALDQNGQALPEVNLNFQLDTQTYEGVIYPINTITGLESQPATALYCPEQGFVGSVEIDVNHVTGINDLVTINYVDDIPECEDCIAELIIVADEYILPAGENFDITQTTITATLSDSAGYDPEENTLCSWQAIQQNDDGDWVDVGSIDEFSYFQPTADPSDGEDEMEATTTFQMYDAAGLITIVGTASEYALTDTIYINTITTQPSYIEIVPPFPNEIMVQGGGGIESTDVDVAIKDGTGNYISIPYWVRFTLIGAPLGCNMDGDDGNGTVDVLSQNGISTVSVISGTRPGAVQLRVELYPDVNGTIDDSGEPIAVAEGTPVTIATGSPAQGVINYSYVDIEAIDGGLYQIPVSVDIWDVHSNPVQDSTNVYFSVRGIAPIYNETEIYLAGDQVYWQSENDLDSLVYECKAPLEAPATMPFPYNLNFEPFTCQNGDGLYTIDTDIDLLGVGLWEAQPHPANIEPVAKTGNENPSGDSYPGKAWTYLYYSSSTMFDETVLFAQTYGANGSELLIDSRDSHDGASLVLPFTPDGTIGVSVNPGAGEVTLDAPELFVTVTGSITDYYQYAIDNGTLQLTAPGATVINVCDGIDQDNDGTGVCFGDDNNDGLFSAPEEQLPFNTCTICGQNGGAWIAIDNEFGPAGSGGACTVASGGEGVWYGDILDWCGDGISDDDPTVGISNNQGQVTWTIRYDLGINVCENCDDENNASCEDFESNIIVQLADPQGGISDPATVTVIQPNPLDECP